MGSTQLVSFSEIEVVVGRGVRAGVMLGVGVRAGDEEIVRVGEAEVPTIAALIAVGVAVDRLVFGRAEAWVRERWGFSAG